MLLGTHTPRLDAKGRLALPAKFRSEFEEGLVITKGQERCLFVFPMPEFDRIRAKLAEASMSNPAVRAYNRNFFAGASDETPDAQGRITIPPVLREWAGLTKDCVVIGANTRVEVWDSAAWDAYLASTEQAFADGEEVIASLL